jgi:hypothetical protein
LTALIEELINEEVDEEEELEEEVEEEVSNNLVADAMLQVKCVYLTRNTHTHRYRHCVCVFKSGMNGHSFGF